MQLYQYFQISSVMCVVSVTNVKAGDNMAFLDEEGKEHKVELVQRVGRLFIGGW